MSKKNTRDLRQALEWLESEGDAIVTDQEVDPDLEITGIQKLMDGGCPILFNNVKGKPHARAVTNLFGDINVVDKMFGFEGPVDRTKKIAHALNHPMKSVEMPQDEAPCQEHVITDDLDVNKWLVPIRHTELETELTIGSGQSVVVGDYFDGGSHIGYNRMNFRWGNVGTFQSAPGSHIWQIETKHYRDEEPIPLTMCFGIPPAANLIAGSGFDYAILPYGADELGVAGAVQGEPLRIVKAYKAATFHVTAITMRNPESKPIIFPLGVHTYDNLNIDTTVREAAIFELCERLQPGIIQDVHIPYCMTDWGGCVIQVKKHNKIQEGWQRNFLSAILSCSQGMRLAIAVSPDTDIYSMDDIMWNLTTRVNPRTDILNPLPGGRGQTFMPAERMTAGDKEWTASNTQFEGGMGIDATVPYGYEQDFHRPVYPVDRVKLEDFFTEADIQNVHKRMEGWVWSLAKTGR